MLLWVILEIKIQDQINHDLVENLVEDHRLGLEKMLIVLGNIFSVICILFVGYYI